VLCVPKSACAERVIGTPFFFVFPIFILILFHSQVHDIHPSHPFILVPDKPKRSTSEPDFMASQQFDSGDEQCRGSPHKDTFRPVTLFPSAMKHPEVQCFQYALTCCVLCFSLILFPQLHA